jgi:hypothetical protein
MNHTKPNIYQRLNAVMQSVKYVQKDKDVSGGGQNYKAVTHDKVISVCRAEMVRAGIVVCPTQVDGGLLIQRDVSKDIKMHLYCGTYDVAFVNIDDQSDRMVVRVQAHANDSGDKAPGKALTYATKSAILKALMLETGDDDESRASGGAVDVDAILLEIDGINDLKALRAKYDAVANACAKSKDAEAWKSLKPALTQRAAELKGAQE